MVLFVLLLILFQVPELYADEASLIAPQPQSLNEMDDYIIQEEARIKMIKLLSLDLERSNIELKQKEVQVKMAQLNKEVSFAPSSLSGSSLNQPNVSKRLIGLIVAGSFKEALVDINGVATTLHEGDSVIDGKIERIATDEVMIVNQDGSKESLKLTL